jgi:internalin A
MQNSNIYIPQWALEKIRETKEKKSDVLDLSGSSDKHEKLAKLPDELFELRNLRDLDLRNNQLSTLPESISQLQNLKYLDLSYNQLNTLPESISQLQNLTDLDLGLNQLDLVPESIAKLQNLTYLDLRDNQLSTLPESISQLQNLTSLNLIGNQLNTIPESISQLRNLKDLYLGRNQLSRVPESISQLQNLTTLDLGDNQLSTLPDSITHLQNLKVLFLKGNQFSTLFEWITHLESLTSLNLRDNPLISPPIEIATEGLGAIREYFRQLIQEGVEYLYEAKLLILGEGGAGKTTFANKILDSNYALKVEDSTKGVDVLKWSFSMDGNKQFKVNIWDFGGQEIYHATHQFFLTRRSLYTLVADTRKDDTDFYYWLNVAELLSDGSPLLIIKNEIQDRHREINERQLKGQFDSLKEVLATNLATNRGLEEAKEEIKHYIRKLPHIGTLLPKTWVRVREQLEKHPHNYISLEEYLAICNANGFNETKDSLQLSGYLHDIGVFLHFQNEPLLRRTVILKPKWGTDAVYKVLDNQTVVRNLGRFTYTDLERIWNVPEYETMRYELLQLMMKFKLCYEIPTQKETYIAPQLLTENQPDYEWDDQENLLMRYNYEFMPKGILTQFIVVMHPYIWEQRIVWKSGLVIEKARTRAEVIEYYGKREIHVRVTGEQKRDLMTVIRHELNQIHDTYRKLKYDELIQCKCYSCKDNPEPHFYSIAELMDFRANGQQEIQCRKKPYNMVNVMRLLGDMIDLSKPFERDTPTSTRTSIYIKGNYYGGDNKMTKINQTIHDSNIHGSVVAAESIKDSFNLIEKADIKDDLKEQLKQLTQAVDAMIKRLPKEESEEAAEYMKVLAEQATKEKPNPKWYNVSIEGLIAAAQNLGKVGEPVIKTATKVLALLVSA